MTDANYDSLLEMPPASAEEVLPLFKADAHLVIFDIGACEGEDSLRYARLFPDAKIFAFEPFSSNIALIRHHFERHRATQCQLVPVALSDQIGEAVLNISSGAPVEKSHGEDWNYGNKSSSLLAPSETCKDEFPWLTFDKSERIVTDTVDHFCETQGIEKIDFVHMDVQGAEWLVLQGAHRMLASTKAVWLEIVEKEMYAGQKLRSDIRAFMRAAGFTSIHSQMYHLEGDELYVNLRYGTCLRRVAALKIEQWIKGVRRRLGTLRKSSQE